MHLKKIYKALALMIAMSAMSDHLVFAASVNSKYEFSKYSSDTLICQESAKVADNPMQESELEDNPPYHAPSTNDITVEENNSAIPEEIPLPDGPNSVDIPPEIDEIQTPDIPTSPDQEEIIYTEPEVESPEEDNEHEPIENFEDILIKENTQNYEDPDNSIDIVEDDQLEENSSEKIKSEEIESEQDKNEIVTENKPMIPPHIEASFRFTTVEKVYAISKEDKLHIYEEPKQDARIVGDLGLNGLCYILKEEIANNIDLAVEEQWVYVESGAVRGFVKRKNLLMYEEANEYVEQQKEENLLWASTTITPMENTALAYTKTTVYPTVVDKVYAIVDASTLNIREEQSIESNIVGKLPNESLCYVIAKEHEQWVYIESGNVRGFVNRDYLIMGQGAQEIVAQHGEENLTTATQTVHPEENKALYYTFTSVYETKISEAIGAAMVNYAKQFLGNPYVWGGTSLTDGADCSGFTQSIYGAFGYQLPRVSGEQAQYGTKIAVEDAQVGDLIFYAKEGEVYHVVMYIGEGKVIHASSSTTGIIISDIDLTHAVWATRIITENDSQIVDEVNQRAGDIIRDTEYTSVSQEEYGSYLGEFKVTAYCNCPICCGKWANGNTASGSYPVQGRTIAMEGLPFGTELIINGFVYTIEDRGTPYGHVDIYMNNHNECNQFGLQYTQIYKKK